MNPQVNVDGGDNYIKPFSIGTTSTATIKIMNIYGEVILTQFFNITQGVIIEEFNLAESFASGIYLISVYVDQKVYKTN